MSLKYSFQKFLWVIGKKSSKQIAKELGVKIGEGCELLCNPYSAFGSEPYLITLGDHVRVTKGCLFITHDGGAWVIRGDEGCEQIDKFGKITVGNNVFIGMNSIIMPGVTIGDNVVIGAGSIVTKSIPNCQVWAGVPARFIKDYDNYKQGLISNGDNTKGMSAEKKFDYLKQAHPEWFVD